MTLKNIFILNRFALMLLFALIGKMGFSANYDYSIKTLDGKNTTISSEIKDNNFTVISFWATWCKPCLEELEIFSELYEDWKEDYNVEILAVSQDNSRSVSRLKPFVNLKGWEFPVFSDPNGESQRAFSFTGVPYLVVLNKNGKIVYKSSGYTAGSEEKIEKILAGE